MWYGLRNGIIMRDVIYAFAKTFFWVELISLSHSAYIISRIITTFRRSCHMPLLKPFVPFTLTANKSTDVIPQPKLSSHWDDRFSDVKYCGRDRHFLGFARDNQVSLYNWHYGGAHRSFWLIARDTRGEKKRKISRVARYVRNSNQHLCVVWPSCRNKFETWKKGFWKSACVNRTCLPFQDKT